MRGYLTAIFSSISVGVSLRLLMREATKTASGKKLMLINFLVNASSSGAANGCNTVSMRYAEIEKGINVYSDQDLQKHIGISSKCAESAVYQTAISRVIMSLLIIGIPTTLIMFFGALNLVPKARLPKSLF
jgi:hypothetical protein